MERVEELMAKRKFVKHCLQTGCAAPEDCVMTGKIKVAKIYSNLLWQREEPELYDAIQAIAPERWGEDTRVILNKDLVAKRHKDGNKGHSWCLWLGDFTKGGGLNFDDGSKIERSKASISGSRLMDRYITGTTRMKGERSIA